MTKISPGHAPAIHINRLTYQKQKTSILNDLNLKLELGEFYAVIGQTGAGKTSLMRLMMGMERVKKVKYPTLEIKLMGDRLILRIMSGL